MGSDETSCKTKHKHNERQHHSSGIGPILDSNLRRTELEKNAERQGGGWLIERGRNIVGKTGSKHHSGCITYGTANGEQCRRGNGWRYLAHHHPDGLNAGGPRL
jgi:hypothetical protein